MKRRHTPGMGIAPHARRRAWQGSLGVVTVAIMVFLVANSVDGVSGARQTASPAATPNASPAASPAASPVAETEYPSTQIIVGEITIEMTASGFGPTYFESAVGRDITITVINRDSEPHNFTIEKLEIDIDLEPGETATIEIEQPPLGRYDYISDLPGDEDMRGAFTVFI